MKPFPIRPQPGFLIVSKDVTPGSVGDIILPEQNSLRPTSGTVVEPADDLAAWYPKGTKVIFGPYAGSTFTIEEGTFTMLTREEVQATIAGVA